MKIIMGLIVVVAVLIAGVSPIHAQPGVIYPTPLSDWAAGYPSVPGGYYGYGYGGYYGGYPGWVSENTQIRSEERWGPQGGERRYQQKPSLPAKIIDAVTLLGVVAIIFR